MKNRGISGFGVIVLIIIILLIGYVAWQIVRVHLTYGTISEKVEQAAKLGPTMTDMEIVNQLMREAKDVKVELNPDSIFIDRSIPDSFRVYVSYDDSSDVFGMFVYRRHFVVDKIEPIKVIF